MKDFNDILKGYDNMRLVRYDDPSCLSGLVPYNTLAERPSTGVLKANVRVDGKLMQSYTEQDNHVAVVAATRLGKTTSYVIPTLLSFARQKKKRGMIIADPKGELYKTCAATMRSEGYEIILLNFRDYTHSECWNPLTPIFRKYRRAIAVEDEVGLVETENGPRNIFRGVIYESQSELDRAVQLAKSMLYEEVGNEIDAVGVMFLPTLTQKDPYWENSARELLKGFLWAMLEDSEKEENPITEDTYSFSTILTLLNGIHSGKGRDFDDDGYFTDRPRSSRAYQLAKNTIIENGDVTRSCILAVFNTGIATFRDSAIRLVTSCNSFDMSELVDRPVAVFIDYRDELKVHYQIISLFVQDAYRYLIERATANRNGKLDNGFYFVLDEFGNFPAIKDFETTISACAGRNIWFILIIQSYAQLNNVYGQAVAEIIRDNLNVHVFFGSNNPATLEEFSRECGQQTRISPLSALNGKSAEIDNYFIETIPLVPKSMLSCLSVGECVVTEANSGYIMLSKMERYYLCDEFKNLPVDLPSEYKSRVNPFDARYVYKMPEQKKKSDLFDF